MEVFKWPKGPVVFTSHIWEGFHAKIVGVHIFVALGELLLLY